MKTLYTILTISAVALIALITLQSGTTASPLAPLAPAARTIKHQHWTIPSNREGKLPIVRLKAGDYYVLEEAKGTCTFTKPDSSFWKRYIVNPLTHAASSGATAYCGHPACGAAVNLGSKLIFKRSKKPRPADNVPVDPHRKEGGVFTIDPDGRKVWAYQHLATKRRNRYYRAKRSGWLYLQVHDQRGKFGDNEGIYRGSVRILRKSR